MDAHSSTKPVLLVAQKFIDGSWMQGPMLPDEVFGDFLKTVDLRYLDSQTTESLVRQIPEADVFIRGAHIPIPREALVVARRLKGIVQIGIGLEHIDIAAASEQNIMVANTPFHVNAVAEGAILLLLAVSRKLPKMIAAGRAGSELGPAYFGVELYGKTLGVVGLGRIGSRIARIAAAMGMHILTVLGHGDPATIKDLHVDQVALDDLLRRSDFVMLSCPLTEATERLIGERELRLMKQSAYFINMARGQVTDEKALYRALKEGWIAGAGLDVFIDEPLRPDNPFLALDNVIATPHSIGGTREGYIKVFQGVLAAIQRILAGQEPECLVNKEALAAHRRRR